MSMRRSNCCWISCAEVPGCLLVLPADLTQVETSTLCGLGVRLREMGVNGVWVWVRGWAVRFLLRCMMLVGMKGGESVSIREGTYHPEQSCQWSAQQRGTRSIQLSENPPPRRCRNHSCGCCCSDWKLPWRVELRA